MLKKLASKDLSENCHRKILELIKLFQYLTTKKITKLYLPDNILRSLGEHENEVFKRYIKVIFDGKNSIKLKGLRLNEWETFCTNEIRPQISMNLI